MMRFAVIAVVLIAGAFHPLHQGATAFVLRHSSCAAVRSSTQVTSLWAFRDQAPSEFGDLKGLLQEAKSFAWNRAAPAVSEAASTSASAPPMEATTAATDPASTTSKLVDSVSDLSTPAKKVTAMELPDVPGLQNVKSQLADSVKNLPDLSSLKGKLDLPDPSKVSVEDMKSTVGGSLKSYFETIKSSSDLEGVRNKVAESIQKNFESISSRTATAPGVERPESIQEAVSRLQQNYQSGISAIKASPRTPGKAANLVDYVQANKEAFKVDKETIQNLPSRLTVPWKESLSDILKGPLSGRIPKDVETMMRVPSKDSVSGAVQSSLSEGSTKLKAIKHLDINTVKSFASKFKIDIDWNRWKFDNLLTNIGFPLKEYTESAAKMSKVFGKGSFIARDAIDALNLPVLGPWYLAAFGLVAIVLTGAANVVIDNVGPLPLSEKEKMKLKVGELSEAVSELNSDLNELNKAKAEKEYEVATLKTEMLKLQNEIAGKKTTEAQLQTNLQRAEEDLATESKRLKGELQEALASEAKLKSQLASLEKKASEESEKAAETAADALQVEALKAEKVTMSAEIDSLTSEVVDMRKQLELLQKAASTPPPAEAPAALPKRDAALPKRAAAVTAPKTVKKTVKKATKKAKKKAPATAPVMDTLFTSAAETVIKETTAPVSKSVTGAAKKVAKKTAKKKSAPEMDTSAAETVVKENAAPATKAVKGAAKKVAKTKTPGVEPVSAFFATPVSKAESPMAVKGSKKAAAVKATTKVASAEKKAKAAPTGADSSDDWSKLSPSTLKRKTVKDLTEYLISRGASIKDADGKALKKDALIETVLSS